MLLTGLLASAAINPAATNGLIYGGWKFFLTEAFAIVVALGYSFLVTFVILKAIEATVGVRADTDAELAGLDVSDHAENAYQAA